MIIRYLAHQGKPDTGSASSSAARGCAESHMSSVLCG